jgi:hypothetical protein
LQQISPRRRLQRGILEVLVDLLENARMRGLESHPATAVGRHQHVRAQEIFHLALARLVDWYAFRFRGGKDAFAMHDFRKLSRKVFPGYPGCFDVVPTAVYTPFCWTRLSGKVDSL